jgi:CIC family chloride channel protein
MPARPASPAEDPRSPEPAWRALARGLQRLLWPASPLELRLLGRTLLHAALVGVLAGLVGAAFFAALEVAQRFLLEGLAGYAPVRAKGETFLSAGAGSELRPWVLAALPALGALGSGLLTWRFAPEAAGGGGDATIESYHHGGVVRPRLLLVKPVAAILTLASGGSGGREGPTMQIGGAIGALVGRWLPTSQRERRILIVAGIAAGIAAVFRTPLGAALLATEMLYQDDFEADALVPAILASVVAYSVVLSIFGETTLFGDLPRFSFVPAHLPLYILLALLAALGGVLFIRALRGVQRLSDRLPVPIWLRPALGGLVMGALGTAIALGMGRHLGPPGARVGVFSGGYGVAQVALNGMAGLPGGWKLVALLAGLFAAKLVASAVTIGSGAAAGDFAPSIVLGGLLGSAFGHAAALLLHDPSIDPTAFALIGMGTFYGGIAHAPLSALVLVSELAGSYDLLVPMMFTVAVAFVALRRWTIYAAQPLTKADSPAFGTPAALGPQPSARLRAADLALPLELGPVRPAATVEEILATATGARRQRIAVVAGADGKPLGLVDLTALAALSRQDLAWALASDVLIPFVAVEGSASLDGVRRRLDETGMVQLPVLEDQEVIGVVGEAEVLRAYAGMPNG